MDTVVQFKLKVKNDNGTFSVNLKKDLSQAEMMNITLIASNLMLEKTSDTVSTPAIITPARVYGPQLPTDDEYTLAQHIQPYAKFGKAPVTEIKMGDYKEPDEGVRLKIFPFALENRMMAIKTLRKHTGISLFGCRDIMDGNFLCPKLSVLNAAKIYGEFRSKDVYCKIISAEEEQAA